MCRIYKYLDVNAIADGWNPCSGITGFVTNYKMLLAM